MNPRIQTLAGLLVLLVISAASTADAVVDPDPNRMSIYFDLEADVYDETTVPYVVLPAYIILTNPTFPALYGYEMGVQAEGSFSLVQQRLHGQGPITVGCWIIGTGCHVGLSGPMTTSEATLLVTLELFILDSEPIRFTLHGASPPSSGDAGVPAVLLDNDVILPIYPSFWDEVNGEPGVCAVLNGYGVAADATSWDAIKSIYR